MTKPISRSVHAMLDYAWSGAISAAPQVFEFADEPRARRLCKVMGALTGAASSLTRYELGALKVIPFNTHLALDGLGAVAGLASPWLLGFAHNKKARNAVLAFFFVEAVVVLLSQPDED